MTRPLLLTGSALLILVLGYATWATMRMMTLIAVGGELVAESKAYEQAGNGQPRILVMGDSTAVGTGVTDPRGSIAGRFGQDFPGAEIRNLGINGLKVAGLLEHFPSYPQDSFDLVLIQIGANDIMRGTGLKDFERDLRRAFEGAQDIGKHVVALHSGNIGLAPLFPWPVNSLMRSRTLAVRNIYRRIAKEEGVTYVDLFHEREDDPFKGQKHFYGRDELHLSEAGYEVWYEGVRAAMRGASIQL